MFKNEFYKFVIFTSIVLVFSLGIINFVKAEDILPDNVKITTSNDGSSTTVIINSKPDFSTKVQTNCVNEKCTSNAVSSKITEKDIKKMQDDIKKHQEAMEKFWQIQENFFQQQQKLFQELWGFDWI